MQIDEKTYFEHLYKEYSTLSARLDAYTASSFDDFKLLAVIGLVFAWEPVTKQFSKLDAPYILWLGFSAIALVVAIMECRDLLKHSLIRFYLQRLIEIEEELLELADRQSAKGFHTARSWPAWYSSRHIHLISYFQKFLYGTIIGVPFCILAASTQDPLYYIGYLVFTASLAFALNRAFGYLRNGNE